MDSDFLSDHFVIIPVGFPPAAKVPTASELIDAMTDAEPPAPTFKSQAARDAQRTGYGNLSYWQMLDESAERHATYFAERGDDATAAQMFTRTLSEALAGNDGD